MDGDGIDLMQLDLIAGSYALSVEIALNYVLCATDFGSGTDSLSDDINFKLVI